MNTLTATNARADLFNLLKQTISGHLHTRITTKEGSAIILSESDYESLLETSELLVIPQFKEKLAKADKEIQEKKLVAFSDYFKD